MIFPSADPWRRFMSAIYEGVILFGVVFFFYYAFSALTQLTGAPGIKRSVGQLFLFFVLGIYFVWFWCENKRTLPMKTMGLIVVDQSGNPVTKMRAFARYCAAVGLSIAILAIVDYFRIPLMLLLLPVPFAWSFFQKDRQALYDVLAGTRLVVKAVSAAEQRTNPVG